MVLRSVCASIVAGLFLCGTVPSFAADSSLMTLLKAGNRKAVERLLNTKKSFDINERDDEGLTPLIVATVANDSAMAQALLSKGANPNLQANNGMTALMAAAFHGRENIIPMLLAAGANTDLRDTKGRTALIVAAKVGTTMPVTQLLEGRSDVRIKDANGNTALMVSCGERHLNVMMELLTHGADPNDRDPQMRTPLMLLSVLGEDEMIRLLLKYKPDLHLTDLGGKTALAYAREYNRRLVIEVLERAGCKY